MNILFLHRGFPSQFKHIATELAKDPRNVVLFLTNEKRYSIDGVAKIPYGLSREVPKNGHPYLTEYESFVSHGQSAAAMAQAIKDKGIIPDVIFGHSWGPSLFIKEIFPDVPLLSYFEWYDNANGGAIGFDGKEPDMQYRQKIRCNNAQILLDLVACDAGICPTQWQKSQFPQEFHHKIKVLHDGIDTDACQPNPDAKFLIKDKNIELTINNEVITYATRGMEPSRGFPEFMKAVERLLVKRPNAHFVIAGEDNVYYGEKLKEGTYKQLMLKQLKIDTNRVHFTGALEYDEYIKLLQISSAHVYLTYPFILSWSFLEAMSTGCCIIASNTQPIIEFMQDAKNGLLVDFFDVNQLVEKIEYALDNRQEMCKIRENARKTILENYALKDILPKQIEYLTSLIKK